jgi:hypothetical protein
MYEFRRPRIDEPVGGGLRGAEEGNPMNTGTFVRMVFGNCSAVYALDALRANDHEECDIGIFEEKKQHHDRQFPIDCRGSLTRGAAD